MPTRCPAQAGDGPLLPAWSSDKRSAPSAAFRGALFPSISRGKRTCVTNVEIFTVGHMRVRFSGERFDRSDLDVFMEIINAIKEQPERSEFAADELLVSLNKGLTGAAHAWLQSVIARLTLGMVEIITPEQAYVGHLVESASRCEADKHYVLRLNPEFMRLFQHGWSSLDMEQRRTLKNPTARAVHAYLSSHKNPGRHTIGTLASIAGIAGTNATPTIVKALDELKEVGFLSRWEIVQDTVILVLKAENDLR
ncbi:hypothetical protein [Thiocystis violacea]|uniref:hypothetical protein n=1 Tax=Thiocystis violacea TaxID=13725 RepID=UPI001907EC8D|nr:hypothetical protein [Thiocystis violacea]